MNKYLSIITLNVNGLSAPIKRHRVTELIKKKKRRPTHMLPTRDPPQNKRPTQTESEGLEKIFQANGQEAKPGVCIIISDEIHFKTKSIKR